MDITKKGTIQPIVSLLSKANIKEPLLKNYLYALLKGTFKVQFLNDHYFELNLSLHPH